MCLLLTLLAVPVFYSLFEDAKDSRVWSAVGSRFGNFRGGAGRRFREAYASLAATFARKPKPASGTYSRGRAAGDKFPLPGREDGYADHAGD